MSRADTIVAVATPPGKGALALVRISGPQCRAIFSRVFESPHAGEAAVPRRATVGYVRDESGRHLDRVVATFFPGPFSYTGEDVAEISCHGSLPLTRSLVGRVLAEGARLAEPGEFTLRAFVNGKMDLAQAEAVRDLVESRTRFQARLAAEQLEGALSRRLSELKEEWVRVIVHMETALEFVEDVVEPEARESLLAALRAVEGPLAEMEAGFRLGRVIQDGLVVSIVGRPNAGKSSLFNALLQEDRAIVTEVPGTTRDALSEGINLGGIPARLIDTAGIREAADRVERLGVEKSLQYLRESHVALFVLDSSEPFSEADQAVLDRLGELAFVAVLNKSDLPRRLMVPEGLAAAARSVVEVSALERRQLEELREAVLAAAQASDAESREGLLVTNLRQQDCMRRALASLRAGAAAYREGLSEEFPLYDLRRGLNALGEITGETTVEDILQQIFSTFCIGK